MSERRAGIRVLLDKVIDLVSEARDLVLNIQVQGTSFTLTADLAGAGSKSPARETAPPATVDPADLVEATKTLMADGQPRRLKDIADKLAPGQPKSVVKPAITALLRDGTLRQDVRGLRLAGAAPGRTYTRRPVKPRAVKPTAKPTTAPVPAKKAATPPRIAKPAPKPTKVAKKTAPKAIPPKKPASKPTRKRPKPVKKPAPSAKPATATSANEAASPAEDARSAEPTASDVLSVE